MHIRGLDKLAELADMDVRRISADTEYDRAPNVSPHRTKAAALLGKAALVSVFHQLAEKCEFKREDHDISGNADGSPRN